MPPPIQDEFTALPLTRSQRYRLRHLEQRRKAGRERSQQWRKENPERSRDQAQRSYDKNVEQRRADARKHSRDYRQRVVGSDAYRASERERSQRRRALLHGTPALFSEEEWVSCCDRFDFRCAYCHRAVLLTADHVVPLIKGGAHAPANIVPACRSCNSRKRDRDVHAVFPDFVHHRLGPGDGEGYPQFQSADAGAESGNAEGGR